MDEFYKPDSLSLGSKGLVYIGDQLLVYKRDEKAPIAKLKIDVPGGGPKTEDKTPFETFKREVSEEFGLDISKDEIVHAKRMASVFEPGKFGWFAVAKLPAQAKDNIVFGDEGLEYMFMSEEEFLARDDAWDVYQDRARIYIKNK